MKVRSRVVDNLFKELFNETRSLTEYEAAEARIVFAELLHYDHVYIYERSVLAKIGSYFTRGPYLGFVFLYTVNFNRHLNVHHNASDMAWLVHELMHVLQYQKYGFSYIFLALKAQIAGGYDYGEISDVNFSKLNLEQQAQLVQDYYPAMKRRDIKLPHYQKCIDQMKQIYF